MPSVVANNRKKTCGDPSHAQRHSASMSEGRVAEFRLGPRKLSVMSLGDDPGAAAPAGSLELGRFTLQGTVYAIVGEARDDAHGGEPSPSTVLTGRELQIASLVADGLLNKQIADRLQISEWTVCAHLRRIFSKLRVSTRAAMVYRCAGAVFDSVAPGVAEE
jgi:DNA-binding CsgD family transcriptional regulator